MAGMIKPNQMKIVSISIDQMKQISKYALLTDGIQLFFCFCYGARILFLKIMEPNLTRKQMEERNKRLQKEGYNKTWSIITDAMVIIFFLLKFYYSQVTNYHDIDAILNDNYNGIDGEQYIDMVRYADAYMEQYQMYTVIIILNMFNLLNALRIFRIVHWIMLIVERTFGVIALFMMLLMPI